MVKKKRIVNSSVEEAEAATVSARWHAWLLALVIVAGLAAYSNVYHNTFLYDDEHYLVKNRYVHDFSHLSEIFTQHVGAGAYRLDNFYRPIQLFAYTVLYSFCKLNVFGYHLFNVLLHIANAGLLYFFLFQLWGVPWAAGIASALFVVHPIHTEAVTYINGTADPLASFFILLGLLVWIHPEKQKENPWISVGASLPIFALALMSKETAVVFPVLVMATDYARKKFSWNRWPFWSAAWSVAGVYMALRFTVLNFTQQFGLATEKNIYTENLHYRLFTFLASVSEYMKLLFWPAQLKYDRPMVVYFGLQYTPVWTGLLVVLAATGVCVWLWKKKPEVVFGIVWFFAGLGPVCGLIPVNGFTMEHWLYLPSMGFLWMIGWLAVRWVRSPTVLIALTLSACVGLGLRTYVRNKDWLDPITFYSSILDHNPMIARVRNNLAMAYAEEGRADEAEREYLRAIELDDRYPETQHNLGVLYIRRGEWQKGKRHLERALELDPTFVFSKKALLKLQYDLSVSRTRARTEKNK